MDRLAVFTTNTSFLAFTRHFESRIFGSIPASGLGFLVRKLMQPLQIKSLSGWADYVLVDFLTKLGVKVTHYSRKPVHIRIHRYEIDKPELFHQVNWDNVKSIIADSEHYADIIQKMIPFHIPVHVMHAGVDMTRWPFNPSSSGKICTWSVPDLRKRLYDLMLALKDYRLYIGGYSANDRHLVSANKRFSLGHIFEPDVRFPDWQADKEFYIHHSLDEGLPVSVGEAMSAGLIPLVHRFPSSTEIVPKELTYVYNSELRELIDQMRAKSPEGRLELKRKLRERVKEEFSAEKTAVHLKRIFRE